MTILLRKTTIDGYHGSVYLCLKLWQTGKVHHANIENVITYCLVIRAWSLVIIIARSSNGRIPAFEAENDGSNPSLAI